MTCEEGDLLGTPMHCEIRRPLREEAGRTYPAVFILHGIGSDERDMLPLAEGIDRECFVFAIRGPLPHGPGFAYFTIEGYGKPDREAFEKSVRELTEFIDAAREEYPLDPELSYVLGFSQGAILALTLGVSGAAGVRGIVALAGYLPDFVKQEQVQDHGTLLGDGTGLSAFISHGRADAVLPFAWGRDAADFLRGAGARVVFWPHGEGHYVPEENAQASMRWLAEDMARRRALTR